MRNTIHATTVAMILGGAALVGCDTEQTPTTPPQPAPQAQTPAARAEEQARDVLGQAGTAGQRAAEQTGAAAQNATEQAGQAAGNAASGMQAEAQRMIDQVKQFIADKKHDQAEPLLGRLEQMRDSLPQAMKDQITNLRQMFNQSRGAGAAPAQ